jgi:hypothetical protein
MGTYVQELHQKKELHKHQIKNDEQGLYTFIKDGEERGERHSGC